MSFFLNMLDRLTVVFLRDVMRYRAKVIRTNLQAAFHYPSPKELQTDVNGYYYFLAKIIREIISVPSKKRLSRLINLKPSDAVDQWLQEGKCIIITSAHIGNWEWSGMYMGIKYQVQSAALYKQIKTGFINKLMLRRRKLYTDHLIEIGNMSELLRFIKYKPSILLMIADQNPGSDQGIVWAPFLGRDTAFINGPEKLATKYKLPVVFLDSISTPNGGYQLEFKIVSSGNENTAPGEITKRYMTLLENNILMQRTQWLWSHKRWKRNGLYKEI